MEPGGWNVGEGHWVMVQACRACQGQSLFICKSLYSQPSHWVMVQACRVWQGQSLCKSLYSQPSWVMVQACGVWHGQSLCKSLYSQPSWVTVQACRVWQGQSLCKSLYSQPSWVIVQACRVWPGFPFTLCWGLFYPQNLPCTPKIDGSLYMLLYIGGTKIGEKCLYTLNFKMWWEPWWQGQSLCKSLYSQPSWVTVQACRVWQGQSLCKSLYSQPSWVTVQACRVWQGQSLCKSLYSQPSLGHSTSL